MDLSGVDHHLEEKQQEKQSIRKRRLGMAFFTYFVPFALVVIFYAQGMIALNVVVHFALYALLINCIFLFLFHTNRNLKFSEPSLTAPQMTASIIPVLYVMYFLDDGQARAIFMLIIAIPLMYGTLALTVRQFIKAGFWFLFLYCAMVAILWLNRPEALSGPLEFIQLMAYILVIVASSIIGGFIYNLRLKLRERNRELKDALSRIEELVNVDSLTGICNRRRLFEVLSQEVNRYSRAHGPFSVCIMDIDYFKQVNDVYGHLAGDQILREIAGKISEDLRSIDCFGRYGGEEFLLVLPHTPLEGARIKAERVRHQVEALRFPDISEKLRITISIGVAEYRQQEDIDETLSRADERLYSAKRAGRNRVVSENNEQQ